MKILHHSALLLKTYLPAARYKVFLSSLSAEEQSLYDHCITDDYKTDKDAAIALFGIKSKSVKYQRLKKNLQDKIYDFTLFVKPSLHRLPKEYDGYQEIFKVDFLINIYSLLFVRSDIYVPLAKKYFDLAYRHYLNSLIISICKSFINYYGVTEYNAQLFNYYNIIYASAIDDYHIECKSDLYYQAINTQFGKSQSIDKAKMMLEIEGYIAKLQPYENKVRSQIFHSNYYGLHAIYYHIQRNYEAVVAICDMNISYLKTLPFKSVGPMKIALKRKVTHLILLKRYDEALNALDRVMDLEIEGSPQIVRCHYLYLVIHMYKKEYSKADDYIRSLLKDKIYIVSVSVSKHYISLFHVYLSLFKSMGIIPRKPDDPATDTKKYIRDHPSFAKDKSGMNIPIIIAQLLEAIVWRNESDAIDRAEALYKYASRYMTKTSGLRSNCFIHMLIAVVKHNYHVVAIERHTKKYSDILMANPRVSSDEEPEIELITYEDLWAILMEYLGNRKK